MLLYCFTYAISDNSCLWTPHVGLKEQKWTVVPWRFQKESDTACTCSAQSTWRLDLLKSVHTQNPTLGFEVKTSLKNVEWYLDFMCLSVNKDTYNAYPCLQALEIFLKTTEGSAIWLSVNSSCTLPCVIMPYQTPRILLFCYFALVFLTTGRKKLVLMSMADTFSAQNKCLQ